MTVYNAGAPCRYLTPLDVIGAFCVTIPTSRKANRISEHPRLSPYLCLDEEVTRNPPRSSHSFAKEQAMVAAVAVDFPSVVAALWWAYSGVLRWNLHHVGIFEAMQLPAEMRHPKGNHTRALISVLPMMRQSRSLPEGWVPLAVGCESSGCSEEESGGRICPIGNLFACRLKSRRKTAVIAVVVQAIWPVSAGHFFRCESW
jgi:hypothetical protein